MKVFICGANCTGKTTLINDLSVDMGLEKLDSFTRNFREKNPKVGSHMDSEFQDKALVYFLSDYMGRDNFISSRSIVDSYSYLQANKTKDRKFLFEVLDYFKKYFLSEDCIYVYLPVSFEINSNGKNRDADIDYQMKIDEEVMRFFENLMEVDSDSSFHVLTGTPEERVQKLTKIIKDNE